MQFELFPPESEFNSQTARQKTHAQAVDAIRQSQNAKTKGRPIKDLTGNRYGKLKVVGAIEDDSTPYCVWLCQCDCGEIIKATSTHLRTLTHCGCQGYGRGRRIPGALGYQGEVGNELYKGGRKKDAAFNALLANYRYSAKKRGISWQITDAEFKLLTKQNCHYCGAEPTQTYKLQNRTYTYNGVDRKDSSVGYTFANVVACCGKCNIMKNNTPYDEFMNRIHKIAGG